MIKLYYHIYTSSHRLLGLSFVDQQMRRIYVSELPKYAQLNCLIHGPYNKEVEDLVNRYGNWRIIDSRSDDTEQLRESRTLEYLWQETNEDDLVLFLHTKGIAYHSGENRIHGMTLPRNLRAVNSWRFALEYFCLDLWRERITRMSRQGIDTESAFLNLEPYWTYCGNIWWAKGSHIRLLPNPVQSSISDYRSHSKSWLFSRKGNHVSMFHVLDRPREDGRNGYGTFRLHEDDLMQYLIEDRDKLSWERTTHITPECMLFLEQYFTQQYNK